MVGEAQQRKINKNIHKNHQIIVLNAKSMEMLTIRVKLVNIE